MKYEIKNWSEFQQYKDDRPLHWIKLHVSLLDDFSFNQLSEIDQLHLVKLWMVAAKHHGKLEGDEKWLAKLVNTKKLNINNLLHAGFIVRTKPYETVPREEKRREEESREEKSRIEDSREDKTLVELKPDEFEQIWIAYGKKGNKKTSLQKFKRLKKEQLILFKHHFPRYVEATPDKQYRKDLQTYINQECWNDEIPQNGHVTTIQQTQDRAQQQANRIKKQLGWIQ